MDQSEDYGQQAPSQISDGTSHLEYLSNTALILRHNQQQNNNQTSNNNSQQIQQQQVSKYAQLLNVLEDMGKDIRPTYAGSKSSGERLKRSIVHARILVRECLMETERSARQ